jgi:hypothetical protein
LAEPRTRLGLQLGIGGGESKIGDDVGEMGDDLGYARIE